MKKLMCILLGFILGIVGTSYAAYKLKAEQVSFDKTNTNLNSENVQTVIDELATNISDLKIDNIYNELENGHPIICSMRPGDFTSVGHFIVLTGMEDGKIRVNDPNSLTRSRQLWDYSTLSDQISNLWVFEKK